MREAIETDPDCSTDNPMFGMVEQAGIGSYLMPGTPLDFSDVDRLPARPAPRLGEHTDEILLDVLGLSEARSWRACTTMELLPDQPSNRDQHRMREHQSHEATHSFLQTAGHRRTAAAA